MAKRIRRLARAGVVAFASLVFLGLQPTRAQDAGPEAAIHATISRQLDAFKHDDAAGAYALAAPGIKAIFPDAGGFLAMVKNHYAPVYAAKSFAFGEFKTTDAGFSQAVNIIDAEGQAWTALYTLAKDPDGAWRITGCALVKNTETSV